jgi:hypothetical protein
MHRFESINVDFLFFSSEINGGHERIDNSVDLGDKVRVLLTLMLHLPPNVRNVFGLCLAVFQLRRVEIVGVLAGLKRHLNLPLELILLERITLFFGNVDLCRVLALDD